MLLVCASKMARFFNASSDTLLYTSEIQICNVFSFSYTGKRIYSADCMCRHCSE